MCRASFRTRRIELRHAPDLLQLRFPTSFGQDPGAGVEPVMVRNLAGRMTLPLEFTVWQNGPWKSINPSITPATAAVRPENSSREYPKIRKIGIGAAVKRWL